MTEPFPLWKTDPTGPQPSQPAYAGRDQAHPQYAPQKSTCRDRRILGKAETERVQTLHLRAVPVSAKEKRNGCKAANPKYIPKPYEQMQYPGQRVQIDVKFVPQACIVGQQEPTQWFQYTFLDEYSRFRYLETFQEHSTYSSTVFLRHVVQRFPYLIECVQTDNGTEFTNRLLPKGCEKLTMFERELARLGIRHNLIRPYTPRHNGKVERSHRKDNEEFYASHHFYSFDDFKAQLAVRERAYNNFPIRPLNWQSPKHVLSAFLAL